MCGLITLISKRQWGFNRKDTEVFEELLIVDQLRGQDATGAFSVMRNKQVAGVKGAFTPWHLFKMPEYEAFRQKVNAQGRIMVGHNRKATQGAATNPANAHPFVEDNIILVHNGSLWNRQGLPERDVDSHAVAAAFAKGDYAEVISDIKGAYCFIWWDMKDNKLRIVRNKERPLFKLENKDIICFASEAWMANGVLRRNGYGGKGEEFTIEEVPVDVIHHYEIGGKLVEEEGVKKAPVVVHHLTPTTTTNSRAGVTTGQKEATRILTEVSPLPAPREASFPFAKHNFKVGQRVLVQINNVRTTSVDKDAKFKAIGITVEPGQPIVDCVGTLPHYVTEDATERWMQYPVEAEIQEVRSSMRGPSLTLGKFTMVGLLLTHPTGVITEKEWDYVVKECSCKHCNAAIGEYEPGFTSVKPTVKNENREYEVTCADCIEEKICEQNPEVGEEFTNGRINALQAWEQIGGRSSSRVEQSTQVQGSSATH